MKAALVVILPDQPDEDGDITFPELLQRLAQALAIPEIKDGGKVIITIRDRAEAVIREAEA